jgi:ppGpp synthetase/RelA/SpoT-type nucleotidyltranferase
MAREVEGFVTARTKTTSSISEKIRQLRVPLLHEVRDVDLVLSYQFFKSDTALW